MNKKAVFFITDCGNGHRSCAESLKILAKERYPEWEIDIVNPYKDLLGIGLEGTYNDNLKWKGFQLACPALIKLLKLSVKFSNRFLIRKFRNYLQTHNYDLVVSLMPYLNDCIAEAAGIKKFYVLMTDWSDRRQIWMGQKVKYIICNTSDAAELAAQNGIKNICQTSGMILKHQFYKTDNILSQSLPPAEGRLTAIMMYALGSVEKTLSIFHDLESYANNLRIIVLCGNNKELFEQLSNYSGRLQIIPIGFTKEVACYFGAADFFIGKPGPGSLSEAFFFNLPIITELNIYTLPQEIYNARLIRDKSYGIVLNDFRKLPKVMDNMIKNFSVYKNNIIQPKNLGVYEAATEIFGNFHQ